MHFILLKEHLHCTVRRVIKTADFVEVMKHRKTMCDALKPDCSSCGLCSDNNNHHVGCNIFIYNYSEQAEEIIMNWAKEHPVKTNADKFKEVFGYDLAKNIGQHYCAWLKCDDCDGKCKECECNGFWNQEYKEPKGETNDRAEE